MRRAACCMAMLLAFSSPFSSVFAGEIEEIAERVQVARKAFETEVAAIFGDLLKEIDANEVTEQARTKPDPERIKSIKAERQVLEKQKEIPSTASLKIRIRSRKNITIYTTILSQAHADYLKANQNKHAEEIAAELESLKITGSRPSDMEGTADKETTARSNDAPALAVVPFNASKAEKLQKAWAKYLKVDVDFTNSIGMKFRLIPPGEFKMGSSPAEIEEAAKLFSGDQALKAAAISEGPQHKVKLTRPIFFGEREVTQAEYQRVMGRIPPALRPRDSINNMSWG